MTLYTVQEAASELGIGQRHLFRWLRGNRAIDAENVPYTHVVDAGWMVARWTSYPHPTRGEIQRPRPMITRRGLAWIRGRLDEEKTKNEPQQPDRRL